MLVCECSWEIILVATVSVAPGDGADKSCLVFFPPLSFFWHTPSWSKQDKLLVLSRTLRCALAGLLPPSLCRASMPGPQHSAGSWDQPGLPTRRFCPWFENSIYLRWVTIVTCGKSHGTASAA